MPTSRHGSTCSNGSILAARSLNKAEVRRGALSGPFMSLVIELAQVPHFVALAPVSDKLVKEREREELVTRFFAYSDGLEGYKDRPSEFLFNYAKRMNAVFAKDPALVQVYRRRIPGNDQLCSRSLSRGFRRTATGKATPRARFEAISIGSFLALQANPQLLQQRPNVAEWIDEKTFTDITRSDGANAIARLTERMNFVRDRLLEA